MGKVQQRVLAVFVGVLAADLAQARRFYKDDPLWADPPPLRVEKMKRRKVDDYYDFFTHTFGPPGERNLTTKRVPAQGVNTLGEVPDGEWYVNRHGRKRMTREELLRGPDGPTPPSETGVWKIVGAKTQGITPGFTIVDSAGKRFLLKFDPLTNPEMATATDVIGAHFFHALGYHTAEYYIVRFPREKLDLDPKTTFIDRFGKSRPMTSVDVDEVMHGVWKDGGGLYRGTVSLFLKGTPVGERRFYGTRKDDPNDIVPHEHRRDLRGLFVFSAWLGHDDSRAINSLDMLVDDGPLRYVKHYLIDFGSILGSASTKSNSPRSGNQYLFSMKPALAEIFSLGLYLPKWATAKYPNLPAVGLFEYELFDPERYKPEYPNPAFLNREPEDNFWAAKQVMRFTDEEIAGLVRLGQYSDPRSAEWITKCLIERRNKIGKTYFKQVLPLDGFQVRDGQLVFEDLGATYKISAARTFDISWSRFDNEAESKSPIAGAAGARIPSDGAEYLAADIKTAGISQTVTAYLHRRDGSYVVVGLDRHLQ